MSFSRQVDIDIIPGIIVHVFSRESANLILLLHYRARPNPKLTREANRSINPGDAEAAQSILLSMHFTKYTEEHNFRTDFIIVSKIVHGYRGGIAFLYGKNKS